MAYDFGGRVMVVWPRSLRLKSRDVFLYLTLFFPNEAVSLFHLELMLHFADYTHKSLSQYSTTAQSSIDTKRYIYILAKVTIKNMYT